MTGYHRPITEAPASAPGPTYHQPATPTPTPADHRQPPTDGSCPLCYDYDLWPAAWRTRYWLPPREHMCDVHVGQHDFLTAVYAWNEATAAGNRKATEEQAAKEDERSAAQEAAPSGLLA